MSGRDRQRPTTAEWVIFAVAAALIAAVAGVLIADWVASPGDPASFVATVIDVEEIATEHHVEVEVENAGDEAAAEVTVSATLDVDGDVTELDEIIAFLASDEDTTVTFIFEDDPSDGELTVSVSSYREP